MLKENFVRFLENSIKENWDLPAFSNYKGDALNYSQVADKIIYLHHIFQKSHIKKDDKISILGKNSVNWAITYLAAVTYGAIIVPILPDFKPDDVHHIVNHSDSILFFSEDSLYENLDDSNMLNLEAVISLNDFSILFHRKRNMLQIVQKAGEQYLEKFDNELSADNFVIEEIPNEKLAAIIYTSGTTGFSKGVMLPHNSLASNIVFARFNMPLVAGDKIVSFLPIAHVFGCVFEFLYPFTLGCHITFLGKIPSPKILIKAFGEIKPRLVLTVPLVIEKIYKKQIKPTLNKTLIKILMKIPFIEKRINQKINAKLTAFFGGNFFEIVIGGAALNNEVETFLRKIKFKYTIGYGMTECGPLISYTGWDEFKKGSCGKIVDRLQVKIDSEDQYNIVGEIMVKGENVMYGYYKNDKATQNALEDGWLRTGDLGIIDKDNTIYIKGRCKSMILSSSGQNIYPEEIEAFLNNLPFVQESIVIERNKQLVALVYPDLDAVDTAGFDEQKLDKKMKENLSLMNSHFPKYMTVSKIELYPEEFEKTPKKSIKRFLYMH